MTDCNTPAHVPALSTESSTPSRRAGILRRSSRRSWRMSSSSAARAIVEMGAGADADSVSWRGSGAGTSRRDCIDGWREICADAKAEAFRDGEVETAKNWSRAAVLRAAVGDDAGARVALQSSGVEHRSISKSKTDSKFLSRWSFWLSSSPHNSRRACERRAACRACSLAWKTLLVRCSACVRYRCARSMHFSDCIHDISE